MIMIAIMVSGFHVHGLTLKLYEKQSSRNRAIRLSTGDSESRYHEFCFHICISGMSWQTTLLTD